MSTDIGAALRRAEEALAANADGALERGQREGIWAALGPTGSEGRRRRTQVGMAAVEQVLVHWKRVSADRLVEELLEHAQRLLDSHADPDPFRRELGEVMTKLDDLAPVMGAAVTVGYAAAKVLRTALFDEEFDPAAPNLESTDGSLDPDIQDAPYLSSIAASGGPPWSGNGIPERRAFWTRWLREAVSRVAADEYGRWTSARGLLALVRAFPSFEALEAIEAARTNVASADVPELVAAYPQLDWQQRGALILLMQDHQEPSMRPMMVDYLSSAPDGPADDSTVAEARAVALCYLDGSFDKFDRYIADPAEVERRRRSIVR